MIENKIKEFVINSGADACGIAAVERFSAAPKGFRPCDIFADCRSVVVFAKRLPRGLAAVSPRIIYNHTTQTNLAELDRIALKVALEIEQMGGISVPLPSDGPYDDWDREHLTGRGLLSMRHAAVQAGLGSPGKNTLVINGQFGNMLNFGAVLTNLVLRSNDLAEELCIPNCRLCLDACPTHALDSITVNQQLCRPYTYETNARGFSVVNCNRCRVVCPRSLGVKE